MISNNTPKHILFVAQYRFPDTGGGTERHVTDAARFAARAGFRVTVFVMRAHAGLPARETTADGVAVVRCGGAAYLWLRRFMPQTFLDMVWSATGVARLFFYSRYDIVHIHHLPVALGTLTVARLWRTPALYHFHASMAQEWDFERGARQTVWQCGFGWLVRRLERSVYRRADHLAVLSNFSRRILTDDFNIPTNAITVIPGGVDTDSFAPAARRGAHPAWSANGVRLVSVRRLEKRMGLPLLIEAVARVRRAGVPVNLAIAGAGSRRAELETLIARLDAGAFIKLLGFVPEDDLRELYRQADLFVLPTAALEGFGLATVESLASGTPALVTAVGASPEIVRGLPHADILVAPRADVDALACGIRAFCTLSAEERAVLRRAVRTHAINTYGWLALAERYTELYERLTRQ